MPRKSRAGNFKMITYQFFFNFLALFSAECSRLQDKRAGISKKNSFYCFLAANTGFLSLSHDKSKVREIAKYSFHLHFNFCFDKSISLQANK